MTDTSPRDRTRLTGLRRLAAAVLGFALVVPLAVSTSLEPDPRGHGTHQQFGLPPCTVYQVFGVRCPTCGMTTSWAHLVRGRLVGAFGANAGGAMLGLLAAVAAVWLVASAARGRWLGCLPSANAWVWIAAVVLAVTLVDWGLRILIR